LGFDTSPFIYFIERHPAHVDVMRELIHRVDAGAIAGYSSVVTLTEVLTRPMQTGDRRLEYEYRSHLQHSRHFVLAIGSRPRPATDPTLHAP
jgi:predicted nucleic acid-binding protein